MLQPFIVASWEGPDRSKPVEVEALLRVRRPEGPHSNVTGLVLNPGGEVIDSVFLHPIPSPGDPGAESHARWFAERLLRDLGQMGPGRAPRGLRDVVLPGSDWTRGSMGIPGGVRVRIGIDGDFNAPRPIMEVVRCSALDWAALPYPVSGATTVPASAAGPWLAKIYPPAMMDQDNRVGTISGTLTLEPMVGATVQFKTDRALLRGEVTMVMPASKAFATGAYHDPRRNPQDFTYRGHLEVVLKYNNSYQRPTAMEGIFTASYRRPRGPDARLTAVIESLPR